MIKLHRILVNGIPTLAVLVQRRVLGLIGITNLLVVLPVQLAVENADLILSKYGSFQATTIIGQWTTNASSIDPR